MGSPHAGLRPVSRGGDSRTQPLIRILPRNTRRRVASSAFCGKNRRGWDPLTRAFGPSPGAAIRGRSRSFESYPATRAGVLLLPLFAAKIGEGGIPSRGPSARLPGRRFADAAAHSNPTPQHAQACCFFRFLRQKSERVGFEPTIRFHVYTLSKRAP